MAAIRSCAIRPRSPTRSSTHFVAANPKLALDAAAIRAGEKATVPVDQAIKDKLITAEEAAGATEVTGLHRARRRRLQDGRRSGAVNWPMVIAILFVLVIYVTMVYGPIAAILVEMFPTRIRYTGMSLPYHIGNGWFGGLLPATVFAHERRQGRYLLRPLVPDRDCGDVAGHRHAVRQGYARHRPARQGIGGPFFTDEARLTQVSRAFFVISNPATTELRFASTTNVVIKVSVGEWFDCK